MADSCVLTSLGKIIMNANHVIVVAHEAFVGTYPDITGAVFADCIYTGI